MDNPGLAVTLLGSANPIQFEDPLEGIELRPRKVGDSKSRGAVLIIVISAVVFITIIGLYEVFRVYFNSLFIVPLFKERLGRLESVEQTEAIVRDKSNAQLVIDEWDAGLKGAVVFFTFALVTMFVSLYFLLPWYYCLSQK